MLEVIDGEEVRRVADLAREIWQEHYVPIIGCQQVEYMLSKFQSPEAIARRRREGCLYFLVTDGEEDIGYFAVEPRPEGDELFFSKFYVRQQRRGEGIGRQMLERVEGIARERGLSRIRLAVNKDNSEAIRVYQHLGFHRSDNRVKDIGEGYVMDDYMMQKEVD